MNRPDYNQAIAHAMARLQRELPSYLTYHTLWHTADDVLPAAERLAVLCEVSEDERRLLAVAAAYHDIGFIYQDQEHERRGARIIAETLPRFGFGAGQIARVRGMILATRLPQSPRNLLEEILADADLDGLGREDFAARSEALRQERAVFGPLIPRRQWSEQQLAFLRAHRYFTPAARALREATKQRHIAMLEAQLAQRH